MLYSDVQLGCIVWKCIVLSKLLLRGSYSERIINIGMLKNYYLFSPSKADFPFLLVGSVHVFGAVW